MKKLTISVIVLFVALTALKVKAQLKVEGTGNVGIGGSFIPAQRLHVLGNAVFSGSTTFTYAPMIQCSNTFSTPTTPEYTWYGNTTTGLFHPNSNVIGFTTGGHERMKLTNNGNLLINSYCECGAKVVIDGVNSPALQTWVNQSPYAQQSWIRNQGTKNWSVWFNNFEEFYVRGDGSGFFRGLQ